MKIFLLLVILFVSFKASAETLNQSLALLGKKQSVLGGINLDNNKSFKRDKKAYSTFLFIDKNIKYQLETITPITEKEFTVKRKNFTALMLKNYQDEPMPYQGEITKASICPKKFTPELIQEKVGENIVFIIKYFTANSYIHRVCEDKIIAYSTCTSFYFDKKNAQYFKLMLSVLPHEDCLSKTHNFFEGLLDL